MFRLETARPRPLFKHFINNHHCAVCYAGYNSALFRAEREARHIFGTDLAAGKICLPVTCHAYFIPNFVVRLVAT